MDITTSDTGHITITQDVPLAGDQSIQLPYDQVDDLKKALDLAAEEAKAKYEASKNDG